MMHCHGPKYQGIDVVEGNEEREREKKGRDKEG